MSANNYILVKEKASDAYEVSERDFEGGMIIEDVGVFKTLRNAMRGAEKHISESEEGIEYGIRFSFNDKK
ncbi:MAG: hypothetical protein COV91_00370 [Candidatus Taylorbacteria bacterium CG11_big_fil_rev_8_21_14_0_20_46_11]|uniref:Uncharacterized protein n=1 Tax=Candidatus Taylorbacteria bacterium CG11_big_fil_rev_8_21_14_0_20_46_11 TaxID=1975025 RepID=A0A2H0KD47_9BACT|nr:MAG: hypothetical protein COV91_00370 [Candidatus Taylorbacteria bacterium CG11_big_fil_rev_8_21_14_0_20_46_11]